MKKLLLLVLPLLVLSGCSRIGNNGPGSQIIQLETQVSGLNAQFTGVYIVNSGSNQNMIPASQTITGITKDPGYLTQVYSTGNKDYLKIDYVQYGVCLSDNSNCPRGTAPVINTNPLIRTFEIAPNAKFSVYKYGSDHIPSLSSINFNTFKLRANNSRTTMNPDLKSIIYYGAGNTSVVEISHDAQKVYQAVEVYRP